jgi:sugar/nucleoside kinase (ribokinase family)
MVLAQLQGAVCITPDRRARHHNSASTKVHAMSATCMHAMSADSACRCLAALQHIDVLKPGAAELQKLCDELCSARGVPQIVPAASRRACRLLHSSPAEPPPAVQLLLSELLLQAWTVLREGLGTVLLSLGSKGCAVCQMIHAKHARMRVPVGIVDRSFPGASLFVLHCPALECEVLSSTGAGDCLVAGSIAGLVSGCSLEDAVCIGVASAARSCSSHDNVPSGLSWAGVADDVDELKSARVRMLWAVQPPWQM